MSGNKIASVIRRILGRNGHKSGSKVRKIPLRTGKVLVVVAVASAVFVILWLLWSTGGFLPRWIDWKGRTSLDVSGQYEITLRRRTVKVVYDNSVIWKTPKDIKVQDAMPLDIDGDGADELVMLCWKIGRFGTSKPFWVEEDEKTWSQHIFVYTCNGKMVKPKWMSSYIGVDVVTMSAAGRIGNQMDGMSAQNGIDGNQTDSTTAQNDIDRQQTGDTGTQNNRNLRQRLLLTDTEGKVSSWIWDSWGFTKEDTDISFVVFGDNLVHEPIYQYGLHNNDEGFDFLFESKSIKEAVASSDVAVINQETPFTDQPSKYSTYPRFGTPVGVGKAIADAGFDVVTCATNHALDQGVSGIDFTKDFFDSNGILCIGVQSEEEKEYRPYEVLARGGAKFALFNYTYGINGGRIPDNKAYMVHLLDDEERVRADLLKAGDETDFVLVFVHWGTEYSGHPDEFQQRWTQIFLESKVDVVVGTHPHALQPCEVLQVPEDDNAHEMLVYYSIGNYISAQHEQSCVKGGMAQFTVSLTSDGYRVSQYELWPLEITRDEDGKYTVDILTKSLEKISSNM